METFSTTNAEGADLQTQPSIDAVFEAGCGDSTVGRSEGIQYVDFDREAPSLGEAIQSAIRDLSRVEGVRIARVIHPSGP